MVCSGHFGSKSRTGTHYHYLSLQFNCTFYIMQISDRGSDKNSQKSSASTSTTARSRSSLRTALQSMLPSTGNKTPQPSVAAKAPTAPQRSRPTTPRPKAGAAKSVANATAASAPSALDRTSHNQSRSRSPPLPDRGPNCCLWCGSKATHSSEGASTSPLDQCNEHHGFHAACCIGVPWKLLCQAYHNNQEDQRKLDRNCSDWSDGKQIDAGKSNSTTGRTDATGIEIYMKYMAMSRADVEADMSESGVVISEKNFQGAVQGIPTLDLQVPGTSSTSTFLIFPRSSKRPDLMTVKLRAERGLAKNTLVLKDDQNCYPSHGNNSWKHLCDTFELDGKINSDELVTYENFKGVLSGDVPPVSKAKLDKSRAGGRKPPPSASTPRKACTRTPCPTPAPQNVAPNASPTGSRDTSPHDPEPEPDRDQHMGGDKLPKSVELADDEPDPSDTESCNAQAVLRLNRVRADLWQNCVYGSDGNLRWQCERAAQTQRGRRNTDVANKLDEWAEKYRKVGWLSAQMIMESSREERDQALNIMHEEYGQVPLEVYPRLVSKHAMEVKETAKPLDFKELLDTTFPWSLLELDTPFVIDAPKGGDLLTPIEDKMLLFKAIVFNETLKPGMIENGGNHAAVIMLCEDIHKRCLAITNQRDFKPPAAELDAMSDLSAALRFVMTLHKPSLLADNLYLDAVTEAKPYLNVQSQGKSCLSAVTYWATLNPEHKAQFNNMLSRLEAFKESAKRLECATEEIGDHTIDLGGTFSVDDLAQMGRALCQGLKAIAYSHGAQVGSVAAALSESMPSIVEVLFNASQTLIKQGQAPKDVMPHIVTVLAEAAVVLPLNSKISDLEVHLGEVQRNNDMNSHRHEWLAACRAVASSFSDANMAALDAAMKKFEGANFYDDQQLVDAAVLAVDSFLGGCIDTFPKAYVREDAAGFLQDMHRFIAKDPQSCAACLARDRLGAYLLQGRTCVRHLVTAAECPMPDSLTDPRHKQWQDAILQAKHSLEMLGASKSDIFDSLDKTLNIKVEKVLVQLAKDVIADGNAQVDKFLNLLKKVSSDSISAVTAKLEPNMGGLGEGKSFREGLPAGKTSWTKYKAHIEKSLGESDICANLDADIKTSHEASLNLRCLWARMASSQLEGHSGKPLAPPGPLKPSLWPLLHGLLPMALWPLSHGQWTSGPSWSSRPKVLMAHRALKVLMATTAWPPMALEPFMALKLLWPLITLWPSRALWPSMPLLPSRPLWPLPYGPQGP